MAKSKRKVIPEVLPEHRYHYQTSDKFLIVNDGDVDLKPIHVPLPERPAWNEIAGYGLEAKLQKWTPIVMPPRLKHIVHLKITNREKWKMLNENRDAYKIEIEYIEKMWDYRINGYWFYNNGKATWITGDHFFFLNFWRIDIGMPQFRSRGRKFYIFKWFCDGDSACYGFAYPKMRREGATTNVKCCEFNIASRTANFHSGMQSMTFNSAEALFMKHVVEPWRKLPFFFQPVHDGTTNPKSGLFFYAPAYKATEDNVKEMVTESLESSMTFKESSIKAYDGWKVHFYHDDECAKTEEVDVYARWRVVKPCLRVGSTIIGKSIHTSTVGEMEKGGGQAFRLICEDSKYEHRDKNGQTKSGLYVLFIPSSDGLEGNDPQTGLPFIDQYGNSNIEAAERYLRNMREAYERDNDYDSLADIIREAPLTYKECWRSSAKQSNFNNIVLQARLDELSIDNPGKVRGNFKWKGDVKDTEVFFEPSDQGRFYVSYLFDHPNQANRALWEGGIRLPANTAFFIAGADPYRFKQTLQKKKSDGAGAVFMKDNIAVDPPGLDKSKKKTHRFCCTYSFRPRDKNEYGEDMIKMCVYYGCEMFPEINVDFIWDYFEERGYGGYLFYRKDPKTGLSLRTPGQTTTEKTREAIFTEYHTYIEQHGMREVHDEILTQCMAIENDMTDFDLFVAGGYALMGAKRQVVQLYDEELTLNDYLETYEVDNSGQSKLFVPKEKKESVKDKIYGHAHDS